MVGSTVDTRVQDNHHSVPLPFPMVRLGTCMNPSLGTIRTKRIINGFLTDRVRPVSASLHRIMFPLVRR